MVLHHNHHQHHHHHRHYYHPINLNNPTERIHVSTNIGTKHKASTTTIYLSSSSHPNHKLTHDEISRYSRHLVLSQVGMKGQSLLKNAAVLVIGAGGLGSPCLMYLAAAGVGHIGIVVCHIILYYVKSYLQLYVFLYIVILITLFSHYYNTIIYHEILSQLYYKRMRIQSTSQIYNDKSFMGRRHYTCRNVNLHYKGFEILIHMSKWHYMKRNLHRILP